MMINAPHTYSTSPTNTSGSSATSANSALSSDGLNPSDFMSLLVAEIQNQDPTQPMDPTTFMSQLVGLNTLEQVSDINQVVQQFNNSSTTATSTGT